MTLMRHLSFFRNRFKCDIRTQWKKILSYVMKNIIKKKTLTIDIIF